MGVGLNASEIVKVMDDIAKERSQHKSRGARVASWLGSKIHKWKKPKNIANVVLEVSHAFIPIPGLGSALINLEMKAVEKIRGELRGIRSDDWFMPTLESRVKFGVKELDVSKIDRGRYKAMRNRDEYNKRGAAAGAGSDNCIKAFWLAYYYRRWQYRVNKVNVLASALQSLSEELTQWSKQQVVLVESHKGGHVSNMNSLLEGSHPDGTCGNACLYHGESTGARNFQAYINKHADD